MNFKSIKDITHTIVVDSTAYPSEMGKIVEQGNDGVRAGLGNKHANIRDVPRFGALLRR